MKSLKTSIFRTLKTPEQEYNELTPVNPGPDKVNCDDICISAITTSGTTQLDYVSAIDCVYTFEIDNIELTLQLDNVTKIWQLTSRFGLSADSSNLYDVYNLYNLRTPDFQKFQVSICE